MAGITHLAVCCATYVGDHARATLEIKMKGERERDKKKRLDLFGLARSNQKCDNNNAEKDI